MGQATRLACFLQTKQGSSRQSCVHIGGVSDSPVVTAVVATAGGERDSLQWISSHQTIAVNSAPKVPKKTPQSSPTWLGTARVSSNLGG